MTSNLNVMEARLTAAVVCVVVVGGGREVGSHGVETAGLLRGVGSEVNTQRRKLRVDLYFV